jgi:hypothetical protein
MFQTIKRFRSAVSLMNPETVRRLAERPLAIGLVASTSAGYADMEDFLAPPGVSHRERMRLMEIIFRDGDPGAPQRADLYFYEEGLSCPLEGYTFRREAPELTVREILEAREDLHLALARSFPPFRKPVLDWIVQDIAKENALFAVVSALPNVVPSVLELPWAMGEFASDTTFITLNQIRMAFMIGAACGKKIGLTDQTAEIVSIAAGALGWRALARELVGKIPLGGGLIPKGAVAYAATYVMGKGIERLHDDGRRFSRKEKRDLYQSAYEVGKGVVKALVAGGRAVADRLPRAI